MTGPHLRADDFGVWIKDTLAIEWREIYQVSGYRVDGVTEIYTTVALDTDYGEFVELNDDCHGFDQVAQSIGERLPGIDPNWLAKVQQLGPNDAPIKIWCR